MSVKRYAIKSRRSKERQKNKLKKIVILSFVCLVFLVGGVSWIFHNEKILIDNVQIEGAQSDSLSENIKILAEENLSGNRWWIFPKKNTFIFSKKKLTVEILEKYKQVKNIVVKRVGFKMINISLSEREPVALWCDGENPLFGESINVGNCYFVDNEGYIYSDAPFFQDHVYFELYGKPFIEEIETTEETKKDEKEDKENNKDESKREKKDEKTTESTEDVVKDNNIGKYFLPPVRFAQTMQFVKLLEKNEMPTYSLTVDSPDIYRLILASGGELIFSPTQDYERVIDDLKIAYKKKFSENPDLSPKDLEYVNIQFDNKIIFKFRGQEE